MLQTSGAQNIAKKGYMKCTFCFSLVVVVYLSEHVCLPAWYGIKYPTTTTGAASYKLVQVRPISSTCTESFLELLQVRVYSYSVVL